jgi:hypothetical protein
LQPEKLALRTICSPFHITPDEGTRTFRISSAAYAPSKSDGYVSVDLEQLLNVAGKTKLSNFPAFAKAVGLIAHSVGFLRARQFSVTHEPMAGNWFHGGIRGVSNKTKQRSLSESCEFVVAIDVVEAKRHWETIKGKPLWD